MLFTEEHKQLRQTIQKVVDKEIVPFVDEWEDKEIFPAHQVFKALGDAGLLGITKEVEYGGLGLDWSYGLVLAEELGRIPCGGIPMAIGVQTDMCTPALSRFGSPELKRQFLAPAIAGDMVGCIGVSEPGAGSDVASIKTTARKDGDDYVINGGKMWITNGIQADWMCCWQHRRWTRALEQVADLRPDGHQGCRRARKLKKLGMWSSDTAQIFFEDVRVPQRYRIGHEGAGFMYQMMQFQEERLWAAANMARRSSTWRSSRRSSTRATARSSAARCSTSRSCTSAWRSSRRRSKRCVRSPTARPSRCRRRVTSPVSRRWRSSRPAGSAAKYADTCLQYWGGMGFMWESKIARMYRDVRLVSIGGGADEVMLSILAKLDGTAPKKGG
jgi:citronellyl-CoA dehydrogenase